MWNILLGAVCATWCALLVSCEAPTRKFSSVDAGGEGPAMGHGGAGAGRSSADASVPGAPTETVSPGVTLPGPIAPPSTGGMTTALPVPGMMDAGMSMGDGGFLDAGAGYDASVAPEATGGQGGGATNGGAGGQGGGVGDGGVADRGAGGQSTCSEPAEVCEPSCTGCLIEGECIGANVDNPDNPCQSCNPAANAGDWTSNDGDPCDDGAFCTVNDECNLGVCSGEERECDDGVSCNGVSVCDDDGDECVPGESQCGADLCDLQLDECVTLCDGCLIDGQCIPDGQEAPGNPCRVCDVSAADDGYTVATGKACGQGPVTCSAQDTCNAQGVCQPNHTSAGVACGNASSSACDAADTCDGAGTCQVNQSSNGTTCDDGQYCTTSSACQGGSCIGTQERTCSANQTCSEPMDTCVCTGCVIGTSCVASGAVNPSNACQICAPSVSASSYSPNTGASCGSAPTQCSGQDTCSAAAVCQANHSSNGSACTGGQCQSGTCEPFTNPFDCVAPDPPPSVLPSDLFGLGGEPPANTGGTIVNGTYTPVRIDFYDGAETIDLMTFEFSNGFVQMEFRYYRSDGVAFIPEVQFSGSYSTSGSTLSFDVERCDPQYDLDPESVLYTVTANGMRIEQRTFNDERVVVTYLRN